MTYVKFGLNLFLYQWQCRPIYVYDYKSGWVWDKPIQSPGPTCFIFRPQVLSPNPSLRVWMSAQTLPHVGRAQLGPNRVQVHCQP